MITRMRLGDVSMFVCVCVCVCVCFVCVCVCLCVCVFVVCTCAAHTTARAAHMLLFSQWSAQVGYRDVAGVDDATHRRKRYKKCQTRHLGPWYGIFNTISDLASTATGQRRSTTPPKASRTTRSARIPAVGEESATAPLEQRVIGLGLVPGQGCGMLYIQRLLDRATVNKGHHR